MSHLVIANSDASIAIRIEEAQFLVVIAFSNIHPLNVGFSRFGKSFSQAAYYLNAISEAAVEETTTASRFRLVADEIAFFFLALGKNLRLALISDNFISGKKALVAPFPHNWQLLRFTSDSFRHFGSTSLTSFGFSLLLATCYLLLIFLSRYL